MKILYFHQYFNTPTMSGFTGSYEMARRLVQFGHDVHMITTQREGSDSTRPTWFQTEESGIRVHWCPLPYSNHLAFRDRIRRFIRFAQLAGPKATSIGGDIIYASSPPLTMALPAAYASKRLNIPMVFEVRDRWPELPIAVGALKNPGAKAAARWLERFAYRRSRHVVALSPGMQAGVVATGYPAERVTVIPNACDFDLFDIGPQPGHHFRQRHEWLQSRRLVVYAGTLGLMNGVGYLARLAAVVKRHDPEIQFVVAGSGREESDIRSLAEHMGVLDRNFHMLGSIPKVETPALLSAADIVTSLFIDVKEMWANSANKFFDGLAAGKPIAINYGGWQAEMLREAEAGLVLEPHGLDVSADRLVAALHDDQWLARAGCAAERLGRANFDRDQLAANLEQVLRTAMS